MIFFINFFLNSLIPFEKVFRLYSLEFMINRATLKNLVKLENFKDRQVYSVMFAASTLFFFLFSSKAQVGLRLNPFRIKSHMGDGISSDVTGP